MNDSGVELYSRNITHNQMIDMLEKGVALLATEKTRFEKFNSPNGWGMWEHFVPFCMDYLQACRDHPYAQVEVSR